MSDGSSRQLPHDAGGFRRVPWGVGAVIFLLILNFSTQATVGLGFYEAMPKLGVSQAWLEGNPASAIVYGLASLASVFILWLFLNYYRAGLKHLGLLKKLDRRQAGQILIGMGAYLALTISLTVLISILFPGLDLEEKQPLGFNLTTNPVETALIFCSLVIVPPLVEEALFRGFVFGGLRARIPFLPAAILTSAIFGLAHFQLNVAIDTFALGLVLAWLYERTGSLWPAITLHALKNLTAFALLFAFGV